MSDRFSRIEAARAARREREKSRQAIESLDECIAPAVRALEAVRSVGAERRGAWDPAKCPLPPVAIRRLATELSDRPRVTHDSGWYRPEPGRPLPPIEAFEVGQ